MQTCRRSTVVGQGTDSSRLGTGRAASSNRDRFVSVGLERVRICWRHRIIRADGRERARLATSSSAIARVVAGQLSWRVGTAILSMRNTQVGVFGLAFDAINSFDGVGNVCEVHKGTVPVHERSEGNSVR